MRTVTEYLKAQPEDRRADMIGRANAKHVALYHRGLAQRGIKLGDQGTIRRVPEDLISPKKDLTSSAESSILTSVDKNTISSPIEQGARGRPSAISTMADVGLSTRQQVLLNDLPDTGAEIITKRRNVSMTDLAALSAATGDEFALFTKKGDRLVVRGDEGHVYIDKNRATTLSAEGYRFSGHTHTKLYHNGMELEPSDGDYGILKYFDQKESVIYNIKGNHRTFENIMRKE
jgi:hypothetical protein